MDYCRSATICVPALDKRSRWNLPLLSEPNSTSVLLLPFTVNVVFDIGEMVRSSSPPTLMTS